MHCSGSVPACLGAARPESRRLPTVPEPTGKRPAAPPSAGLARRGSRRVRWSWSGPSADLRSCSWAAPRGPRPCLFSTRRKPSSRFSTKCRRRFLAASPCVGSDRNMPVSMSLSWSRMATWTVGMGPEPPLPPKTDAMRRDKTSGIAASNSIDQGRFQSRLRSLPQEPQDGFQSRSSLPVSLRKTLSSVGFWTDRSANSMPAWLSRSTRDASPYMVRPSGEAWPFGPSRSGPRRARVPGTAGSARQ